MDRHLSLPPEARNAWCRIMHFGGAVQECDLLQSLLMRNLSRIYKTMPMYIQVAVK